MQSSIAMKQTKQHILPCAKPRHGCSHWASRQTKGNSTKVVIELFWLSLALICFVPSGIAKNPSSIYSLEQRGMYLGEVSLTLSSSGLKAVCHKSGITIVSKAPDWTVTCYNPRNETYWHGDSKDFKGLQDGAKTAAFLLDIATFDGIPLVKKGTETFNGITCQKFASEQKWSSNQRSLASKGLVNKQQPMTAEYLATDAFKLPPRGCLVLERLYHLPIRNLVPISLFCTKLTGGKSHPVITTSCKTTRVEPNWLAKPSSYREVNSMEKLGADSTSRNGLDLILDALPVKN